MCGLIGFSSKDNNADLTKIKLLMLHNSMSRGTHATGFFSKETGLVKKAKAAEEFLEENKDTLKTSKTLIAHVRHATVGVHTDDALAHPFEFDDIVFQHNGTLKNHLALATQYNVDTTTHKVDSHILGNIINKNFKTNTPFKVLNEYEGAAATMTYVKETDTLYVTRDNERDLFFGKSEEGLYISSIKRSLEIINCENITAFSPGCIYKIQGGEIVDASKTFQKKASIVTDTFSYQDAEEYTLLEGVDVKLPKPKVHLKGFSTHAIDPEVLIGLNIPVDSAHGDSLTLGKFYLIEDSVRVSPKSSMMQPVIRKDNNELAGCQPHRFASLDCLPYKGRSLKVLVPDTLISQNMKLGSIVECAWYQLGSSFLVIKTYMGLEKIHISHVRVLSKEEENALRLGNPVPITPNDENLSKYIRDNGIGLIKPDTEKDKEPEEITEDSVFEDIDVLLDQEGPNKLLWESFNKFSKKSLELLEEAEKDNSLGSIKKLKSLFENHQKEKILNVI